MRRCAHWMCTFNGKLRPMVLPLSSAQSTCYVTSACQLGLEMLAQQQEFVILVYCLLHKPWINSKEILIVPMWLCLQIDFVVCTQVFLNYVVYKSNESHNTNLYPLYICIPSTLILQVDRNSPSSCLRLAAAILFVWAKFHYDALCDAPSSLST